MRLVISWKAGAALLSAVVFGMVAVTAAQAQAPMTVPMSVTENREPGLAGNATVTPMGNGAYRVDLRITGFAADARMDRPAHIHTAANAVCDVDAPVTYPFTNVAIDGQGVGTSTTTITITSDKPVTAGNAYFNVHNPAQMGRGVFCGNVTTTLAAQGAAPAAAAPAAAPAAAAPAAAPAAPGAAAAPAAGVQSLPNTGTGLTADTTGAWSLAGLALIGVLLVGSGALAVARKRG